MDPASPAPSGSAGYRSFADATRAVLDLLERHLQGVTVFLAHLDRAQDVHRIVDSRGGAFDLRANHTMPLDAAWCARMTDGLAPRLCNDLDGDPSYADLAAQREHGPVGYLGVPIELSDGSRVGALAALAPVRDRFDEHDERLFAMLAQVLSAELERETTERDARLLNDTLRAQASGMGELGRVARALAGADDARPTVCAAACAVADAPMTFLLEPSGRAFVSTAAHGSDVGEITIQPPGDAAGRAFTSTEPYFVADAHAHTSLADALVSATGARSALFEPVLRDGAIAGVLIVLWQEPQSGVGEQIGAMLRLLATQAAVAIEQAQLRARMEQLAFTDELTGLATRRVWDEELPRELARARRSEAPVAVAVLDIDHMGDFNAARGSAEGDRLVKESASAWSAGLREVDLIARLDGVTFGVLLPNCGLGEACEVVDRLRAATPRSQTASAGVARWDGSEPAELLLARCRGALDAAKESGRDMTIAAD